MSLLVNGEINVVVLKIVYTGDKMNLTSIPFCFCQVIMFYVRMASNFMLDKPICILDLEAYQSTSRLIWRIALWLIRERVPKRDLKIYFNHDLNSELLNQLKWKQPMIQKEASMFQQEYVCFDLACPKRLTPLIKMIMILGPS